MSDEELDSLKQENAALRERLEKAQFETELYRKAAYEMLEKFDPTPAPTDEEIAELMAAPRGESLFAILEEFERIQRG